MPIDHAAAYAAQALSGIPVAEPPNNPLVAPLPVPPEEDAGWFPVAIHRANVSQPVARQNSAASVAYVASNLLSATGGT